MSSSKAGFECNRYCAYNLRDKGMDLQSMIGQTQDPGLLDELISETREQVSATLQEVEWRGRKMAVKQEKARSFLVRDQDFAHELDQAGSTADDKIAVLESFLMDCKNAIEVSQASQGFTLLKILILVR